MSTKLAILGGKPAVPALPPLGVHAYDAEERAALLAVADTPLSESGGPHSIWNRKLEQEFRDFTGARFAATMPNASTAMLLGLRAVGVGPGVEVISSAYDWKANALSTRALGATWVQCDMQADTMHMDPVQAEKLITPRTRVIIVTHVHGTAAAMSPWLALARRYGLFLFVDAAQALGATWNGVMVGQIGDYIVISGNLKKLTPGGDFGMGLTWRLALYQAVMSATNFGEEFIRPPREGETASHHSLWLGGNERANPLAAAVVSVKLGRVPAMLQTARRNAEILNAIGGITGFKIPEMPEESTSTHHLYPVIAEPQALGCDMDPAVLTDVIVRALLAEGVDAGFWRRRPMGDEIALRREPAAYLTVDPPAGHVRPVDPESAPVARDILRRTIILGRAPYGLQHLPARYPRLYLSAFEKIAENFGELIDNASEIQPLTPYPPVPEM
jgi:dTDP-4-amino-4,6-dideoxygalactose transaminase